MEENIYFHLILKKKIVIKSQYLDENIDEYIYNYLKSKIEDCCIDEGYVKKDSVKIIKKSVGMLLCSKFTGDITYNICYTADICNPVIGNIIDCKVKFINKLGILGSNGPVTITVGRQLHNNDKIFDNIKKDDVIKIIVIAKRFYLNDKEIQVVAKIYDENEQNSKPLKMTLSDLDNSSLSNEEFQELDEEFLIDEEYNKKEGESILEEEEDIGEEDDEMEDGSHNEEEEVEQEENDIESISFASDNDSKYEEEDEKIGLDEEI
jgi:DNA-directed RNA polymerase subunit E'/Rpb7